MSRSIRHLVRLAAFAIVVLPATAGWAVSANPLESAYWRFDEAGAVDGVPVVPGNQNGGEIKDSINANHMRAHDNGTTPDYTSSVAPTPLKSGSANNFALQFTTHDDLYTDTKNIDNGMIGAPVAPNVTGFTLEAAFQLSTLSTLFQGIVGREGQPNGPLETLELKVRGDSNLLQIEQFDRAGNLVQVSSINQMNVGQWYYAAVVNDGANLKLYLDSNDGNGYQLQGTTAVDGAMYQGGEANSWWHSWTIGRGYYDGQPADWFNGTIDEVRLTNAPLEPKDFLFWPQGDYDGDKRVDAADYVIWRETNVFGDEGYALWQKNFGNDYTPGSASLAGGAVPEPAGVLLAVLALTAFSASRPRRRN